MSDKYIEKIIEKIKDLIHDGKYNLAGDKFFDLARYGIVIENKLLTFLSSELTDVFRNSIDDFKEFEKELDKDKLNEIVASTPDLLKYFTIDENNITPENKREIFDLLLTIISNSETIQEIIKDIYRKKRIIRSSVRREIL